MWEGEGAKRQLTDGRIALKYLQMHQFISTTKKMKKPTPRGTDGC